MYTYILVSSGCDDATNTCWFLARALNDATKQRGRAADPGTIAVAQLANPKAPPTPFFDTLPSLGRPDEMAPNMLATAETFCSQGSDSSAPFFLRRYGTVASDPREKGDNAEYTPYAVLKSPKAHA